MTTKKKTSKSKPKAAPAFKIELSKRRKPGSRNSTSFTAENPHRFPSGVSGNPGGVPKNHKLLSRTIRSTLSDPCPHPLCRAVGAPVGSSWATVIAHRLTTLAALGDLEATRLIGILTEGTHPRAGFDAAFDDLQRNPSSAAPIFKLCLIHSDGDGRPAPGQSFEGKPFELEQALQPAQPALPAATD